MRTYRPGWLKTSIVDHLKRAAAGGIFDGMPGIYTSDCTAFDLSTGSILIYTRDAGMHGCGWLKNPDYERCLHLSISFRDPLTGESVPYNRKVAAEWVELFFGENRRYILVESPKSPEGKRREVHHYRMFCNEHWQPIVPRKEVYSTMFTETGWKSYSELHPEDEWKEPSVLFAG